ncbi:MAG TPA: YkgJ family cysteine cluster protein [Allosphingosinicella sp.]
MALDDASALCGSCGMCCDGTLFLHAKAEREEAERLAAAGHELQEVEEGLRFRLPCQHFQQHRCTIYPERFTSCRSFRCRLLRRLDLGEVTLEDALATVAKARELVSRLSASNGTLTTLEGRRRLRKAGQPSVSASKEEKLSSGRLHLDSLALDMFLEKHFRQKEKREPEPDPS